MTETKQPASPSMLRAFGSRNYQLFFSGQLVSLIGTWMQNVAQAWLVYQKTGSSLALGTVGFASQIPVFLFAPLGGVLADRYRHRRLLVGTQTASMLLALTLAALTLTDHVHVWHIVALAALGGVVNAIDIPVRQSFVVVMVGREHLGNAIALNSAMFNGARIIGPSVAGLVVAAVGEGWCFFANGLSYLAVIGGLLAMQLDPKPRPRSNASAFANVIEGFRFAGGTAPIRAILLLLALTGLVGAPYFVLMPIFADRVLHGGSRGLGLLMGAVGVGALGGALLMATRSGISGLGRWVAVSMISFGIGLVCFGLSRAIWLSAALLLAIGFAQMVQMTSSNTLLQTLSPDRLRGRVMAVYSMMFMGMAPIGSLGAGSLADRLGAPRVVMASGVVCVIGALVFAWRLPGLRDEARRMVLAQRMESGAPADDAPTGVSDTLDDE